MQWSSFWHRVTHSSATLVGLGSVSVVVIALLIFHAGVAYGERRAFSRMQGYGVPPHGPMLPHGFIPEGHGAVGTISALTLPTFLLLERDGDQEQVRMSSSTRITAQGTSTELMPGESVVVIGVPHEDAEGIDALFIRILPNP